jgi:type IV secretory pathway VirB10-like protein
MNGRLLIAVAITLVIFGVYSWWTAKEGFDINSQTYASAPIITQPPQPLLESEDREVASGGPHTPNQAPPTHMPTHVQPEERPFDPQDQPYETADLPERLRHPERVYSPGIMNETTEDAVASGVANNAQQVTNHAYQTFGPEFATNGGAFLDGGIMANDSELPTSYSSV